jgi:hypothetical protein
MRVASAAQFVGGIVIACAMACSLPGCIAWEIRDAIRTANYRMNEVDGLLSQTNDRLGNTNELVAATHATLQQVQGSVTQTNTDLEHMKDQLDSLHASLRKIDEHVVATSGLLGETNPRLGTTNEAMERLRILQEIQATLLQTNSTLLPLQKAMSSLGGALSFLGMGGEETPAPTSAAAPDGAAPEPAAGEATSAPAESRAGGYVGGTWVLVHPTPAASGTAAKSGPAGVLVLLADGRYLEGDNGKVHGTGKWVRKGSELRLTPETAGGAVTSARAGEVFEVVSVSARALTLRSGSDLRVYARP